MRPRALEIIERNARAQSRLVDDILDVSRIIGGKLRLDLARITLVVGHHHQRCQPSSPNRRPTPRGSSCHAADRTPPGSQNWMPIASQQVVSNLLSNAIKFTNPEGRVEPDRASCRGPWVVIQVTDTGEGIEPLVDRESVPAILARRLVFAQSSARAGAGARVGDRQSDRSSPRRDGHGVQRGEGHGKAPRCSSGTAGVSFPPEVPTSPDSHPQSHCARGTSFSASTI